MTASSHHETGDRSGGGDSNGLGAGILALSLAVLSPFVPPILWAGALCYALYPLYARLVRARGDRRTLHHAHHGTFTCCYEEHEDLLRANWQS